MMHHKLTTSTLQSGMRASAAHHLQVECVTAWVAGLTAVQCIWESVCGSSQSAAAYMRMGAGTYDAAG